MNFHNTTGLSTIAITWAATSSLSFEQDPVGKVWVRKGKWPVTPAVIRTPEKNTWFFERVAYRDLDEVAADIARRVQEGTWTMIAGAPRPELDLTRLHRRLGKNFTDDPTNDFTLDCDGMPPDEGGDLSSPECFGKPIVDALRRRLTAVGAHSLARTKLILMATASSGMRLNSLGQPANGCARFRIMVALSEGLTLGQKKAIAAAIGKLPGFETVNAKGNAASFIDTNTIYTTAGNIFVARAVLPERIKDKITDPVQVFEGETALVDVETLSRELDLGNGPPPPPVDPPTENHRLLEVDPELRVPLVRQAVAAIRNDLARDDWVGMAWAIDGATGGATEAEEIFLEFCDREVDAKGKRLEPTPGEGERVWRTRGKPRPGSAGIGAIMLHLERQGTAEAEASIAAIRQAQDAWANRHANWRDPLPLEGALPAVEPFDLDLLPESIRSHIEDITEQMQCPVDYLGVTSMIALCAALGRRIAIRPAHFGEWFEVANLWGLVVGPPGWMKSPAMLAALKPLRRLEARAESLADFVKANYDRDLKNYERREAAANRQITAILKTDVNAVIPVLVDAPRPSLDLPREYILGNGTYEKIGEHASQNPLGFLIYRDEIMSLLRYLSQEEHSEARGFFLEAWAGNSPYKFSRIGRGEIRIPHLSFSLLGSTQPGLLSAFVSEASRDSTNDGMLQRFGMMVWPDGSEDFEIVDRPINAATRDRAYGTFERLDQITPADVRAQTSNEFDIPWLPFAPDAYEEFNLWRKPFEIRLRSGKLGSPSLEAHFAKYRTLVPVLALVRHLADGGTGPVSGEALDTAIRWSRYLESHESGRCRSATRPPRPLSLRCCPYRLPRLFAKGLLPLGPTCREIWTGDHIARPYRSVLLRLSLAR
jgi:Protein of unknown function (DUF3987)